MPSPLKHFRTNAAARVIILMTTLLAAYAVYFWSGSILASGLICAAALFQLYGLVRYVEKTNRDLARLLEAIRYSDFSQGFSSDERGESFVELSGALRGVVNDFRAARREKEESYRYLQTVMQHVGVGLISFQDNGKVSLINSAAKKMLRIPYLKHIDRLSEVTPRLVDVLKRLRNGDKTLVKIVRDGEALQLSMYATEFKLGGELYKLVSLQNIRAELEDTEVEAWQKLTRVLAHEIMNSIAPIASLASTADGMLSEIEPAGEEAAEELSDIKDAISTIARRSEGLLGFVKSYRRVSRVPDPEPSHFLIRDLFNDVEHLMQPRMTEAGVRFDVSVAPESIKLNADQDQIEQVVINLVKNGLEAVAGGGRTEEGGDRSVAARPSVILRARIGERGRPVIEVSDNGPGIPDEVQDRMFVPFFTTKKDGSGIGLSLSREIVRRNGGSLYLDDSEGTCFVLRL